MQYIIYSSIWVSEGMKMNPAWMCMVYRLVPDLDTKPSTVKLESHQAIPMRRSTTIVHTIASERWQSFTHMKTPLLPPRYLTVARHLTVARKKKILGHQHPMGHVMAVNNNVVQTPLCANLSDFLT